MKGRRKMTGVRVVTGRTSSMGYGRTFDSTDPEDLAYLKRLARETRGDENRWPELNLRIWPKPKCGGLLGLMKGMEIGCANCKRKEREAKEMAEKKIVVPVGMLKAVNVAFDNNRRKVEELLEAALRWLSENPIVPTDKQLDDMLVEIDRIGHDAGKPDFERFCAVEWQRQMFLVSDKPEIPVEIMDLLKTEGPAGQVLMSPDEFMRLALEIYRRGQQTSIQNSPSLSSLSSPASYPTKGGPTVR